MADYDNKNKGVLFKNNNKKEDKHPDYKGNYVDEFGREYEVASWVKTSSKGTKFMSFSMKPKDENAYKPKPQEQPQPKPQPPVQQPRQDEDDSLPF